MSTTTTRDEIIAAVHAHSWIEVDEFAGLDSDADSRYFTLSCYGDQLEVGSGYATLDDARDALGDSSNSSPWGVIDVEADSVKTAFIPIVITVSTLEPIALEAIPTPDH